MDLTQHLLDRHMRRLKDYNGVFFDSEEGVVTFYLWSLTGKLTGYQQYRPGAPKDRHNDPRNGRYFTWTKNSSLACWGMETYDWRKDVLFITEGIFDACRLHNLGLPALAVLSNDPHPLEGFLRSCGRCVIAVCDNDENGSGKKLAKHADQAVFTSGKDLGDSTDEEILKLLEPFNLWWREQR